MIAVNADVLALSFVMVIENKPVSRPAIQDRMLGPDVLDTGRFPEEG